MDAVELCSMPTTELVAAVKAKQVSPVHVVAAVLAHLESLQPRSNAYCTVTAESAWTEVRLCTRAPNFGGLETLSQMGPMTRTVRHATLMLNVIVGPDRRDLRSRPWVRMITARPPAPAGLNVLARQA